MRSMKKMAVRLVTFLIVFAMMLSVTSCFGKKEEETTKHEHSYTEEVIAPTCTEAGYTKFTCGCGHSYRGNEIPAGHQMLEVVAKQPTCTEDGEAAFHVCQLCGYVEGNKTVIPALGHLYDTTYEYPTATEAAATVVKSTPKLLRLWAQSSPRFPSSWHSSSAPSRLLLRQPRAPSWFT